MRQLRDGQKGSVSLFIVIFAALLIITIGTAFIIIMIQGQGQATSDDLSRSALDSANAGVEDAKRAIVQYNSQCLDPSNQPSICTSLKAALFPNDPSGSVDGWSDCSTTVTAKVEKLTGGEVQVGGDKTLNQAYTCVKVEMNTPDYVGTLTRGTSRLIPLKSVGGSFDTIAIEWFSQANLRAAGRDSTTGMYKQIAFNTDTAHPTSLATLTNWPAAMPSLMRSQLLQYNKNGFQLDDFSPSASSVTNADTATLFLYPQSNLLASSISDGTGSQSATPFALYDNSTSSIPLQTVTCKQDFKTDGTSTYDGYACKAVLQLPLPIGASALSDRTAYLRLTAPYKNTDFRVTMLNSQDPNADVHFAGVQPLVDSTGRANDLFRRLKDRVEASGNGLPYPEAALTVGHDVCKSFSVSATDFTPDAGCKP